MIFKLRDVIDFLSLLGALAVAYCAKREDIDMSNEQSTLRTFHCDYCDKGIKKDEREFLADDAGTKLKKPIIKHLCEACVDLRGPQHLGAREITYS